MNPFVDSTLALVDLQGHKARERVAAIRFEVEPGRERSVCADLERHDVVRRRALGEALAAARDRRRAQHAVPDVPNPAGLGRALGQRLGARRRRFSRRRVCASHVDAELESRRRIVARERPLRRRAEGVGGRCDRWRRLRRRSRGERRSRSARALPEVLCAAGAIPSIGRSRRSKVPFELNAPGRSGSGPSPAPRATAIGTGATGAASRSTGRSECTGAPASAGPDVRSGADAAGHRRLLAGIGSRSPSARRRALRTRQGPDAGQAACGPREQGSPESKLGPDEAGGSGQRSVTGSASRSRASSRRGASGRRGPRSRACRIG